jgi:site-specific DNA-methyltransferase (adenine-specific)
MAAQTVGGAGNLNRRASVDQAVNLYYTDGSVTVWHGDCREITDWLAADILVTDPPYGRDWKQGRARRHHADDSHPGIAGDKDTSTRDHALALWCDRPAVVFGDLMLPPPAGTRQVLVYQKAVDAGNKGTFGRFRRDIEAIYLLGRWPAGLNGRTSIVGTSASLQGGSHGIAGRYQHPHAKPVDVMETLISHCPPGTIADPFAGSGSTLVAARNLGRRAIGIEVEERYCELIVRRLSQGVLPIGGVA